MRRRWHAYTQEPLTAEACSCAMVLTSDLFCAPRYEDWIKLFLRQCGPRCANVQLLPVYDLTQVGCQPGFGQCFILIPSVQSQRSCPVQARNDAHHGSFGRGRESWVLDCRHFCTSVVDIINQVLFGLLC